MRSLWPSAAVLQPGDVLIIRRLKDVGKQPAFHQWRSGPVVVPPLYLSVVIRERKPARLSMVESGKIEEAVELLRVSMEQADDVHGKAQNACCIAIAESRRGNYAEAGKYLEEARKLDPDCFLLNRAKVFLRSTS